MCLGCASWAGQCTLGHSLTSLAGCPAGKFPGFAPLGDVVAKVAQPAAWLVDKALGTNLRACAGCANRQDKLNHLIQT